MSVSSAPLEEQSISLARSREWTWPSLLERHVHEIPDRIAVRFAGEAWSYAKLGGTVGAMADIFAASGVGRGDRVAMLLLNRIDYLVAVIAAGEIGAITVPINFRLSPGEVAYLLDDSDPALVVTESALLPLAEAAAVQSAAPDRAIHNVDDESRSAARRDPRSPVWVGDSEPAFIFYTSGTTGRPKGAVLSWRSMRSQSDQLGKAWGLVAKADETVAVATPIFHIAGMAMMSGPLSTGGTVAIQPLQNFDPEAMVAAVERDRVTAIFLVPAQWQAIVSVPGIAHRMPTLRVAAWGAAPATTTLLNAMTDSLPGATVVAHFGQTEMSPNTCILFADDAKRKVGSVGRPVDSVQLRIVDDAGDDVAPGEVGEAVYRGHGLMIGYWNKSEETQEAFAGDWFHSGDLVRADDEGFIYVVDRKKDMIISGGENIYSAEVENALASHPALAEVAVVGRADERWGEVVVAVVVLREGYETITTQSLVAHVESTLAPYKRPKDLVVVSALPRNATGKVLKHELRRVVTGP